MTRSSRSVRRGRSSPLRLSTKKKRRDEIEEYIEMVDANDEKGVFLNLLVVLTAPVKEGVELLQERMEEVCAIGRSDKVGAFFGAL